MSIDTAESRVVALGVTAFGILSEWLEMKDNKKADAALWGPGREREHSTSRDKS